MLQYIQLFGARGGVFLLGDQRLVAHFAQHIIGAIFDQVRIVIDIIIAAGVIAVGISDDGGEAGAFAQRQLVQILAEIVLRGDLDAIVAAAHVDDVQIGFQDLLLGKGFLQLERQIGFLNLALVGLIAVEQRQFDQLAGDRGRALQIAAEQVVDQRAADALDVHTVVLVKARVLNGDDRVDEPLGDLFIFHIDAVLGALEFGHQIAVSVVNEGGERLRADLVDVQVRAGIYPGLGDAAHHAADAYADQQHGKDQHFCRHDHHREQEPAFALARLEYCVFKTHISS